MPKTFDPNIGKATRWVKGRPSPNPGGRPRVSLISEAYRHVLAENFPGDKKKRTFAEVIAERIALAAARGNLEALSELADRAEGKPRLALEFSQQNSDDLEIKFDNMSDYEIWAHLIDTRAKLNRLIEQFEHAAELDCPNTKDSSQNSGTCLLPEGSDAH